MADTPGKVEVDVVLKPRTNRGIALALAVELTGYDDFRHLESNSSSDISGKRTELVLTRASKFYDFLEGQA